MADVFDNLIAVFWSIAMVLMGVFLMILMAIFLPILMILSWIEETIHGLRGWKNPHG